MAAGLFITGTGTDVGKTYVTALLVRKLKDAGLRSAYYKAAVSGADSIATSDAGYVRATAGIDQPEDTLLSYLYPEPLSPHLAARHARRPVCRERVLADFDRAAAGADCITAEGSGGIVCPLCWEADSRILLEDVVRWLGLPVAIVADAGLGTINHTVLTVSYLQARGFDVRGIFLNRYTGTAMEADNARMITALSGVPVVAAIAPGADTLPMTAAALRAMYRPL